MKEKQNIVWRRVVSILCLLATFLYLIGSATGSESAFPRLIHYGVINTLKGVSFDDARVAIQMNFDRQNSSVQPRFETRLEIFPNVSTAAERIKEGKLHGISITGIDFLVLRDLVTIEPLFVASSLMDSPLEPYVLLARKGIELKDLAENKQSRLIVENESGWDIGRIWLETALHQRGMEESVKLFTSIRAADKPTHTVLPVFFNQADACLVSKSAYDTMVELNPQLGKKLHILLQSKGFVRSMICVVDYLDPEFKTRMKDNVSNMHNTVDGRQLLTIFRLRRNFPFSEELLVETKGVLDKYRKVDPILVEMHSRDS